MKAGVVLLGGVIAAGKSSLAGELVARHGFVKVSTRSALEVRARAKGLDPTREVLQRMGDELDVETGGVWVLDQIEAAGSTELAPSRLLLDSVRRDFQISRAKARWPSRAIYVHLTVPLEIARVRYDARKEDRASDSNVPFDIAKASATEQHAATLDRFADLVVDTSTTAIDVAAEQVSAHVARLLTGISR